MPGGLLTAEAVLTLSVPFGWLVLTLLLATSDRGWRYLAKESREDAQDAVAQEQPEALSMAALVFAGIALVGSDMQLARMSDLLLVSLSCFAFVWAASHWFQDFTVQLAGDALRWTGLATFLAAVYEFAVAVAPGEIGRFAVLLALASLGLLSARGAYSHWHNAVALAEKAETAAS